jgi:hypothetical protein
MLDGSRRDSTLKLPRLAQHSVAIRTLIPVMEKTLMSSDISLPGRVTELSHQGYGVYNSWR